MRLRVVLPALACLLAGLPLVSPAQNPPQPRIPLLGRAPEFSAWTVTYKYPPREKPAETADSPAPPEPDRPQSLAVQKTRKIYCEKLRMTSGKTSEKWVLEGGIQLMMPVGDSSIVALSPPNGEDYPSPDYSNYGAGDFPGLEWVTMEHYRGMEDYRGVPVFRFEGGGKSALLTVEGQLPVAASNEGSTRHYAFGPPPTAELTPPKRFRIALETHRKGLRLLQKSPSTP